jgi:type IV secretory pathway VirB4 component
MTGSGKSYFAQFLLQNAQKYAPLTFIFDIGGSFQSLTTIFGGLVSQCGQEARDFTINPFSLPQTKENLQFLFSFFRVLIEGNEQRYRLDFKEERRCGMPSSACTCWSRTSARSRTLATSSAS